MASLTKVTETRRKNRDRKKIRRRQTRVRKEVAKKRTVKL